MKNLGHFVSPHGPMPGQVVLQQTNEYLREDNAGLRLNTPDSQFIAIRIDEVEPASTWERKCLAGDGRAQGSKPKLCGFEIVGVQNTRSNRLAGGEATGEAAIAEFGIGGAGLTAKRPEHKRVRPFQVDSSQKQQG